MGPVFIKGAATPSYPALSGGGSQVSENGDSVIPRVRNVRHRDSSSHTDSTLYPNSTLDELGLNFVRKGEQLLFLYMLQSVWIWEKVTGCSKSSNTFRDFQRKKEFFSGSVQLTRIPGSSIFRSRDVHLLQGAGASRVYEGGSEHRHKQNLLPG